MKISKKVLAAILSVMLLNTAIVASTTAVSAAGEGKEIDVSAGGSGVLATFDDMTKVTGTWDDSKARAFDGKALKITNDVSGNITGLSVKNVPAGVYKVGYFLTISAIKDSSNPPAEDTAGIQDLRFRANPYGVYSNNPYYPCSFDSVDYKGLSTVVGKKVMIVVVIKVDAKQDKIELVAWPRGGYMDATLDKIVFASSSYDFSPKNNPGYTLFKEAVAEEGDAAKKPEDSEWKASTNTQPENPGTETTAPSKTNNNTNTNTNGGDKTPVTGDASSVITVVVAAAAAFGGLKLRRK